MQDIIYVPLPNSNMISYHSPVEDSINCWKTRNSELYHACNNLNKYCKIHY